MPEDLTIKKKRFSVAKLLIGLFPFLLIISVLAGLAIYMTSGGVAEPIPRAKISQPLSLENIEFFKNRIPGLLEVSIGHALISESLYLGIENVIQMYLRKLK